MAGKGNRRNPKTAEERNEELQQTLERLEEGVRDVFTSEKYSEYLSVMSRFHNYSFNNCLLIAMQKPEATLVAGYRAWQDKFGRHVRKGEHGIKIISPVVVKVKPEENDRSGAENPDGKDAAAKRLAGFRLSTVFDVSQTEGRELPSLGANELQGDVRDFESVMDAVRKTSRHPIEFENIEGGAKGYFSHSEPKRIVIQEGMPQTQTIKTAIHELAHSIMHDFERDDEASPLPDRSTREVQAESVAFAVSSWLGLDTSDYSFGYIASWSDGRGTTELKASLDVIRRASHDIIDQISESLDKSSAAPSRSPEREPVPHRRSLVERAGAARAAAGDARQEPARQIAVAER